MKGDFSYTAHLLEMIASRFLCDCHAKNETRGKWQSAPIARYHK